MALLSNAYTTSDGRNSYNYEGQLEMICRNLEKVLLAKDEEILRINRQSEHIMQLYYDSEEMLAEKNAELLKLKARVQLTKSCQCNRNYKNVSEDKDVIIKHVQSELKHSDTRNSLDSHIFRKVKRPIRTAKSKMNKSMSLINEDKIRKKGKTTKQHTYEGNFDYSSGNEPTSRQSSTTSGWPDFSEYIDNSPLFNISSQGNFSMRPFSVSMSDEKSSSRADVLVVDHNEPIADDIDSVDYISSEGEEAYSQQTVLVSDKNAQPTETNLPFKETYTQNNIEAAVENMNLNKSQPYLSPNEDSGFAEEANQISCKRVKPKAVSYTFSIIPSKASIQSPTTSQYTKRVKNGSNRRRSDFIASGDTYTIHQRNSLSQLSQNTSVENMENNNASCLNENNTNSGIDDTNKMMFVRQNTYTKEEFNSELDTFVGGTTGEMQDEQSRMLGEEHKLNYEQEHIGVDCFIKPTQREDDCILHYPDECSVSEENEESDAETIHWPDESRCEENSAFATDCVSSATVGSNDDSENLTVQWPDETNETSEHPCLSHTDEPTITDHINTDELSNEGNGGGTRSKSCFKPIKYISDVSSSHSPPGSHKNNITQRPETANARLHHKSRSQQQRSNHYLDNRETSKEDSTSNDYTQCDSPVNENSSTNSSPSNSGFSEYNHFKNKIQDGFMPHAPPTPRKCSTPNPYRKYNMERYNDITNTWTKLFS